MATARVTANLAVQPLFVTPLHMKAKIDSVTVDNQSGVPVTVQLEDDFTQDISQTVAAPVARSAFPFQRTVGAGLTDIADELAVSQIECLGNVGAICSATQAACAIIVNYHFA
jgi:hypothetical protein